MNLAIFVVFDAKLTNGLGYSKSSPLEVDRNESIENILVIECVIL